jgi:transposase
LCRKGRCPERLRPFNRNGVLLLVPYQATFVSLSARPSCAEHGSAHCEYCTRANRAYLRRRNIKAVIPEKADQAANRKKKGRSGGRPVSHDATLYKDRNTVERGINKFKEWRGLATRYDKTPESYAAGLHLRGSILWLRSLPALP